MRGEELEGLSLEELQQIEKKLEAGFNRVLDIKVSFFFFILAALFLFLLKEILSNYFLLMNFYFVLFYLRVHELWVKLPTFKERFVKYLIN